ncbi:MAG: hypothetical protein ACR2LL_12825 [Nitrosopumilus sp.]
MYYENNSQNTKVEIAKRIWGKKNKGWRNTYSGVYEDIEKVFLPYNIIREKGRIPLKRGPQALQKNGTAIYELTKNGLLLLYCINEGKVKLDFTEFALDPKLGETLNRISEINSALCFLILKKYLVTCFKKKLKMLPLTHQNLNEVYKTDLKLSLELIESILSTGINEQKDILKFLRQIKAKH